MRFRGLVPSLSVILMAIFVIGCSDNKMRRRVATMDRETLEYLSTQYPEQSKEAQTIAEELSRRPRKPAPSTSQSSPPLAREEPKPEPQQVEPQKPSISSSLSGFQIEREFAQFVFTLQVTNLDSKENTVYVIVYGKNDMFSPPRRNAWPLPGLLFREAGTRRGVLSVSAISRNWNSRSDDTKGMKLVLKPNGTESIEGALPINKTCQHDVWRGKPLDPRSMYNEVYLWVFSQEGQLIFEKKYDVE